MNQITVYFLIDFFLSDIPFYSLLCCVLLTPGSSRNAHRIVPYCTVQIKVTAGQSRRWGCHSKSETAADYRHSHWPMPLARGGSGS